MEEGYEEEEVQIERDLRNQRFGKGKHRRKWKNGKRTRNTIRYCAVCDKGARFTDLLIPFGTSAQGPAYSLKKKQRWLLLDPKLQQQFDEQCDQYQIDLGNEEPNEVRGDEPSCWDHQIGYTAECKRIELRNKKRRDRVRIKSACTHTTPTYWSDRTLPPNTPALSSKKRPQFLYTPETEYYRILASDFEDFLDMPAIPPAPVFWMHRVIPMRRASFVNPEDPLWVFIVDDPHRLPESLRNMKLVQSGGPIKTDPWGEYAFKPFFDGNKEMSEGHHVLIVRNCYNASKKDGEHSRPMRGRCSCGKTSKETRSWHVDYKQEFRRQKGVDETLL